MITARFAPVESMCVLLVLLDLALVVLNPTAENQFANLDQTSRASPEPHCAPADQKQRLIGFVSLIGAHSSSRARLSAGPMSIHGLLLESRSLLCPPRPNRSLPRCPP